MIGLGRLRQLAVQFRAGLQARGKPSVDKPACNICGCALKTPKALWSQREAVSCQVCRSTLRFRALMAALQTRLAGSVGALASAPTNKKITGLGMSDASVYANWLARKYAYVNTFFHTQPFFDLRKPGPQYLAQQDFVVSSDVLEHVQGPLDAAFSSLRALLRPEGVLLFTVPYMKEGHTIEHFPQLHDFSIEGAGGARRLVNRTADGREQVFENLCFHGGDGSTLELRVFSLPDLLACLQRAGFRDIRVHSDDYPEWGIIHAEQQSLPISAIA